MSAYESFARVYDMFMDNIPYKEWCNYLTGLLKEYEVDDGLIQELGCGTENATILLSDAGYYIIGVNKKTKKKKKKGKEPSVAEGVACFYYICRSLSMNHIV